MSDRFPADPDQDPYGSFPSPRKEESMVIIQFLSHRGLQVTEVWRICLLSPGLQLEKES